MITQLKFPLLLHCKYQVQIKCLANKMFANRYEFTVFPKRFLQKFVEFKSLKNFCFKRFYLSFRIEFVFILSDFLIDITIT